MADDSSPRTPGTRARATERSLVNSSRHHITTSHTPSNSPPVYIHHVDTIIPFDALASCILPPISPSIASS